MNNPFNDIKNCCGKNNCFGKTTKKIKPIVFSMRPNTMNIMVITEQPRDDRVNKEDLKRAFQEGPGNSIPQKLKELLGDEFCKSVEKERGIFYWTHYIKCPGEFRKLKKMKDKDKNKCADTYLRREIEYVNPSVILSIGARCSSWILETFKDSLTYNNSNGWLGHLWREISCKKKTKIKVENIDAQVIFLIHPSERSGIGWFIDKKLKDMIQKTIDEVKR